MTGTEENYGKNDDRPICLSKSAASSAVARGRTPGSLKLVLSNVPSTKKNSTPPTTGIAGLSVAAKNGQLQRERIKHVKAAGFLTPQTKSWEICRNIDIVNKTFTFTSVDKDVFFSLHVNLY